MLVVYRRAGDVEWGEHEGDQSDRLEPVGENGIPEGFEHLMDAAVRLLLRRTNRACRGRWRDIQSRETSRVKRTGSASGLQQFAKLVDGQTRVLYNSTHRDGIHRIVTRNDYFSLSVRHHDMLALAKNPETSVLQCSNDIKVIDSGQLRHD